MVRSCAILFSGGKDSCLALHMAKKQGYEVKYLLSIIPENFDSFMFHKPYLNLLKKQAEMLGLLDKLIIVKSKGEEEKELNELKILIKSVQKRVDLIVVGGIASSYQGNRIKSLCDEFGFEFYAPLWDYSGKRVWKELFEKDFRVILTKIACEGLGREWLGKTIDKNNFKDLKKLSERYKFRIDFEGGEAESAVLYMPEFKNEIKIQFKTKSEGSHRHFIEKLEVLN